MLLSSIIPWQAKRLEVETREGEWAFNPSIVRLPGRPPSDDFDPGFDPGTPARTLCSVRLANYHMPGGRPANGNPPRPSSRCAMLELDDTLSIVRQSIVDEHDLGSREADRDNSSRRISKGFEDYRLFTVDGDLRASASSACTCEPDRALIEISHLVLRERAIGEWGISHMLPLRGEWSRAHQKNWMPFDAHPEGARWLYSVDRGGVHTPSGRIVAPDKQSRVLAGAVDAPDPRTIAKFSPTPRRSTPPRSSPGHNEVIVYGRPRAERATHKTHGRVDHPLRGGTQLVRVPGADNRRAETWLGLAHGYRADGDRKFYWHAWIAVDERGALRGVSRPFKLHDAAIEFAAGLVIDASSGQVAVSYGVDDETAWIGVARLGDVIGMLPPGSVG